MIRRNLCDRLLLALSDTPVVLINGARQTGKSTLVQSPEVAEPGRRYLTFDDRSVLAAAKGDPGGFIAGLMTPVTLDEVQHVPELFSAIKIAVDRKREPGRFLLTGSADVLLLPKLSESLAGRMEVLTLSQLLRHTRSSFRTSEAMCRTTLRGCTCWRAGSRNCCVSPIRVGAVCA